MTPIANLPARLMSLLGEHLSPEDIRIIADDYGERSGHEGSLYDQLIDRASVQQVVRVLVLQADARSDVMGLVRLIAEHYPALQETLRSLGFETAALIQSYQAALQPEIKHSKRVEVQPETLRYFTRQTGTSLHIQQDQPFDFTLLLPDAPEAAPQTAFTEVDLDELLTTHQYVILSHPALEVTASVLHSLALRMIEDWQHAPAVAPFPVFVPFAQWFNPTIDLHQFLQMHLTWLGIPQFAEVLPDLIHAGRVVLLLEGLGTLPFVKHNALTGLLDDTRVWSIAQLSEEHQWRNVRCVLSCQIKDFLFGPRWHEVHVLDPANEQQPGLSDNPAIRLKTHIDSVFEKASAGGQLPVGMASIELQTCLSRLAFNAISAEISLRHERSSLGESGPVKIALPTAAAWLFHLQELNNLQMEPELEASQEELQLAEHLFEWSQAIGLLIGDSSGLYFSDEHIKGYLCLHYCLSHMRQDPQLVGRLQSVYAREVWWLWEAYDPDLIDKLLLLLHSSDKETRIYAIWTLRWCGDSRAVEPLIAALKEADPFIRRGAAFALGEIEDSRAIEPLLDALKDEDREVRISEVDALNKFHDQGVIEPYITALADYSSSVPSMVREALARFGDAAVLPLMAAIMDNKRGEYYYALADEREGFSRVGSADIPYAAAEILGEIGDIRPLPILMWMVEHVPGETHIGFKLRDAAREAVNKIMKRHQATAPLVAALRSEDEAVRVAAAFTLGRLGDHRATEPLLSIIQHEDERTRWGAVELLGKIGDYRTIIPLIAALKDRDTKVLLNAADTLHKIGEPAVLPLIVALKDENLQVRFQAARILGKLGNKQAVEPLIAALTDQVVWIRSQAVVSLGMLHDKRALEPLIAAAKDPDKDVRSLVPDAIYAIDPDRTVEVLIVALKDKHEDVRHAAARNLSKMGDSRAVEPLITALKDEDSLVRESAAYALGKHGDGRAVEALIENLNDSSFASEAAAAALGEIGDSRAIAPLIAMLESSSAAVDALAKFGARVTPTLLAVLEDDGPNARFYSELLNAEEILRGRDSGDEDHQFLEAKSYLHYRTAEVFDKVGDTRALPTLMWMAANDNNEPESGKKVRDVAALAMKNVQQRYQSKASLVAALNDEDPFTRVGAAFALGMLGDEQATAVLCAALVDTDRRVRWGAAGLLGNLGGEQAIAALINALEDEDADVRTSAVAALVKIGEEAIQPLLAALKEENSNTHDWNWFDWVAYTLSEIGEAALQPLIAALKDQDNYMRYRAANALGNIGNKQAIDELNTALEDDDPHVRLGAAAALTKLGDDEAIELLITALKDEDENIRYFAVSNLRGTGDPRATEALITVLEDRDDNVRYVGVLSLGEVGDGRALPALDRLAYNEPWPSSMGSPEVDWPQDRVPIDLEGDYLRVRPDPSQDRITSEEDTSDDFSPPLDIPVIDMPEQPVEVAIDEPREEQIDERLRDAAREAIRRIKSRQQ